MGQVNIFGWDRLRLQAASVVSGRRNLLSWRITGEGNNRLEH